jgi:hypothetical protein
MEHHGKYFFKSTVESTAQAGKVKVSELSIRAILKESGSLLSQQPTPICPAITG